MSKANMPSRHEPLQFSLIHLFVLPTGVGAFLALERATGTFFASLVLGTFMLAAMIALLRIENIVAGGVAGACFATVFLVMLWLAAGSSSEWAFILAGFTYPVVGIVCAADRAIRSGY